LVFIAGINLAYPQSAQQSKDAVLENQDLILKRLMEIERRDSVERMKSEGRDPLWDYVKDMRDDTYQHREFIESYYDKVYITISIIVGILGVFLGFIGWKSLDAIETRVTEMFTSRFNTRFENLWNEKKGEIEQITQQAKNELSQRMKESQEDLERNIVELRRKLEERMEKSTTELHKKLETRIDESTQELEKRIVTSGEALELMIKEVQSTHEEINKEQSKQIDTLDLEVSELKKNIHVKRSVTILEYLDAKGAIVTWHREQDIVCISEDFPIKDTVERIIIDPPGKVEFVEGTSNEMARAAAIKIPNGCKVTMVFTKPLVIGTEPFRKFVKCRILDGFPDSTERWEIIQPYPCDVEIFELWLPKEKNCKEVWMERISKDIDGKDQKTKTNCKYERREDGTRYRHIMEIPRYEEAFASPLVHVIHWEFSE